MADEFADKLNAVLGNPEAMGQIMSLARSLTGDSGDEEALSPQYSRPWSLCPPLRPPPLPRPPHSFRTSPVS